MKKNLEELIKNTQDKIKSKEYDQAIELLKKILEIDKDNLAALSTLADIYVFKKKYRLSIENFDKIFES